MRIMGGVDVGMLREVLVHCVGVGPGGGGGAPKRGSV